VARRQRGVVVIGAPLLGAAAIRRKRDEDIAEARRTEAEGTVMKIGIGGRLAPRRLDALADSGRELGEEREIVVEA
jgi:hypothetical protein